MKKVLLIVIDALASRVVKPAMEAGRLPTLRALAAAGRVDWNCTAIFPSITPAATAALVTGGYPAESGIAGAYFYDQQEDSVHYYGDDVWAILHRGFSRYFQDFLVQLNGHQLRLETIYETVERAGGEAACLNFLWFRGDHPHRVRVPWLLRLWPGIPWSQKVGGPTILSLGDFVSTAVNGTGRKLKGPGGLPRRYGFTDATTAEQLVLIAENKSLPQLTVAYFPDNDFASHNQGPAVALETVEEVDRSLARLLATLGGIDSVLKTFAIIVTGDHAQSDLPESETQTGIALDEVLADYSIVPAGKNWRDGDELMICPNMRAAQIYLRPGYWTRREEIVARLMGEERIDQVIWRESPEGEPPRYCVLTRDRGRLEFAPATAVGETARDEYGAFWGWRGSLQALDAQVTAERTVQFGLYPNAFERIVLAFDEQVTGDLWITSRLGYEFCLPETNVHRYGSHGSLHVHDSHSPLIMAGVPDELLPDKTPRSVDVAPLCLSVLDLRGAHAVGASHIGADDREECTSVGSHARPGGDSRGH